MLEMLKSWSIFVYYNSEQYYTQGRTHYGFCSIYMPGRRKLMDKIIIALLGAAAVIVQQIFREDDSAYRN